MLTSLLTPGPRRKGLRTSLIPQKLVRLDQSIYINEATTVVFRWTSDTAEKVATSVGVINVIWLSARTIRANLSLSTIRFFMSGFGLIRGFFVFYKRMLKKKVKRWDREEIQAWMQGCRTLDIACTRHQTHQAYHVNIALCSQCTNAQTVWQIVNSNLSYLNWYALYVNSLWLCLSALYQLPAERLRRRKSKS